MIATLLEATEMIGLPILLVSGFVLVVVLALLLVIFRKEKTYEDIVRERERKLGDFSEGLFMFCIFICLYTLWAPCFIINRVFHG